MKDPMMDEAPAEEKVRPLPGAGVRFLLEKGRPGELVPDGTRLPGAFGTTSVSSLRADMKRAARKYCLDQMNHDEAKARVKSVWLDGKHQRPWEPYTPRPGKEEDFG